MERCRDNQQGRSCKLLACYCIYYTGAIRNHQALGWAHVIERTTLLDCNVSIVATSGQ